MVFQILVLILKDDGAQFSIYIATLLSVSFLCLLVFGLTLFQQYFGDIQPSSYGTFVTVYKGILTSISPFCASNLQFLISKQTILGTGMGWAAGLCPSPADW